MAGVDQLQMDLSSPSSVICIALLYLMIPDVPPHWLNVQSLVLPNSIGA